MKLCLIDLGSNSARMSLAELTETGYAELFRRRQMVRLSQGMEQDGNLQETAQTRAILALSSFAKEAKEQGAEILAVATAAVRRAKNGPAFCERVSRETGITLAVISGKMEAQFDFYGVLASLPEEKDCLIADVGGGSTELILAKDGTLTGKISLPFGAMTLTDRFKEDLASAKDAILSLYREVGLLEQAKNFSLIGLGGSAGALPHLDARLLGVEQLPEVHGYSLSKDRVEILFQELLQKTPEERIAHLGLEPGRADTICAGMLPLLLLLEEQSSPYLKICTAGLREGIFARLGKANLSAGLESPEKLLQKIL